MVAEECVYLEGVLGKARQDTPGHATVVRVSYTPS